MTAEATSLERIIEPMRNPLAQFADLIRDLGGANAQALTLFGVITTGRFDARRHVARSVLIVSRVDLTMLRRLSGHGAKLGKAGIAAPLVMTPAYVQASVDTFPLELIEIQQQRVTLFGADLFADLSFNDAHVRLQCERELKVILIGLRQGLLASGGREKLITTLDSQAAEGLVRAMRGLLWFKGRREALPPETVVAEVEKIIDRKLDGPRRVLDPDAEHGWPEFEALYHDVAALQEAVNAW